jgi:hypothetical protein
MGPVSITGHPLSGRKLMQLVYLDEAGKANEAHEPYLVVAGVIVNPDQKWRPLERHFMELSKRCFREHDGPPVVFHAMHIFHGTHLFPREKWSLPRRIKLLERLAAVPKEFGLTIVQGYAHRATVRSWFERTSPNMTPKQIRAYTHAIAFFNAIRRVENWMFNKAKDEVAMLIAEDTPEVKQTIHAYISFTRIEVSAICRKMPSGQTGLLMRCILQQKINRYCCKSPIIAHL